MTFEIREQPGPFAVTDVVGANPECADAQAPALRDGLARNAVLCLRMERTLEDAELQSVARLFGSIKDPVGRTRDGSELRYEKPRQRRTERVRGAPGRR